MCYHHLVEALSGTARLEQDHSRIQHFQLLEHVHYLGIVVLVHVHLLSCTCTSQVLGCCGIKQQITLCLLASDRFSCRLTHSHSGNNKMSALCIYHCLCLHICWLSHCAVHIDWYRNLSQTLHRKRACNSISLTHVMVAAHHPRFQ